MMSAEECRARADEVAELAARCGDPKLTITLEATVQQWLALAETVDWQEEILARLAALGVTPTPTWPDDL